MPFIRFQVAGLPDRRNAPSSAPSLVPGLVVATIALLLVTGCQGTFGKYSSTSRSNQFHEAVFEYNKYIRWQEWERASDYLNPDDQSEFKEKAEAVEEVLRITEFEIRDTDIEPEAKSATARVLYRYYRLPSIAERKMKFTQKWIWSEEHKRWTVEDPLSFIEPAPAPKRFKAKPRAAS